MTEYAELSIKVAFADREYRRLRLEAQRLYEKSDDITEEWLYGSDFADRELAAELSEAARWVDVAAGQAYDVANCMWAGQYESIDDNCTDNGVNRCQCGECQPGHVNIDEPLPYGAV